MEFIKKHALFISAGFLFFLGLFFLSYSKNMDPNLSIAEKLIYITSQPVEIFFRESSFILKKVYGEYIDLKDAKSKFHSLEEKNIKLKLEISLLKDIKEENKNLRKILGLQERSFFHFMTSKVYLADPSFLYKSIRVNKGEKDGVSQGMGLISADGVVGVVMRVSGYTSDALLITDPNSSLDVIVERNRRRGILQGGSAKTMQFKYLERGSDLLVGDEIVTSGLTGSFPGGIPVGRVASIDVGLDNVTQVVDVVPEVDFSSLGEVLILLTPNQEVDVIRKVAGDDWLRKIMEYSNGKYNDN